MPQPARDICSTVRYTRRKHRRLHPIPTARPSRLRPFFPLEIAMVRTLAPLAAVLLLSACSTNQVAQVQPIDGVISGQCHTDKVRGAVGLAAAAQTVERARVDSDSLQVSVRRGERSTGGTTASGLADPAQGASETGGDHLTIETGPNDNITAIYCG
ncbi:hypothetical protein EIQ06_22575 [Xanthomonas campestris pv. campestris]|uniref:Uncharacterized protein n=3 Tax=Xanthomonas campestris pv. campestris TaxID=340 RepID=Q8PEE4_XANCP|nr:conserved hypothetical protein [Xanthomonas campestris pv. campestris str. ATCC 33913]AAY47130.1 conserved hypothetical protein [Xanthomonas campestris pv. campestris str. 8004]QCX66301.1 hypothetical protein DFG55_07445 [Xanthomonas campestris pv. campestris]QCX73209.1 hypothetical protein DFG54_22970 [Xanthomonas campestris pv. campestris]